MKPENQKSEVTTLLRFANPVHPRLPSAQLLLTEWAQICSLFTTDVLTELLDNRPGLTLD